MKLYFLASFFLIAVKLSAQPVITNQPANQLVVWGCNATFSVMVTGTGPFTYQWLLNGTNLPNNLINTVAGGQLFDGVAATNIILNSPQSSAMDSSGNLYITDTFNHVIRKVGTNGITRIIAGTGAGGYSGDGGAATNASFDAPKAVIVDSAGNLFIADTYNMRVRKVSTNGLVTTVAGNGLTTPFLSQVGNGGPATNAVLNLPTGLALDSSGNLYIADSSDNQIRKVNTNGIISTIANTTGSGGYNFDNTFATSAYLNNPTGVAADATGNIYIADRQNNRIRKISTNSIITTIAGTGVAGYAGDGGSATAAKINLPDSVSVDASNNVYFADSGNNCIRKITNGIIRTVAGTGGTAGFSGDGAVGTNATLNFPASLSIDSSNNLFIADAINNRIRKLGTNGIISTVAGQILNDGSPATNATLNTPYGVTADQFGNLFIADSSNARVRKVDTNGVISTFAGNGISGFSGDGGAATNASLLPYGVAIDSSGNVFIADAANYRIRKVDTNGFITTFAGNGSFSYSGNGGPATNAGIVPWGGIAFDGLGNVFVADVNSSIRKIDTNGIITSVAGTGLFGHTGDGGAATNARIAQPLALCFDSIGDLFIAEIAAIRKVDTNGIITTFAGKGYLSAFGFTGDGGLATNALLGGSIWGLWCDSAGNVFISDSSNSRIRKVNTNGIITTIAGNGTNGFSGEGANAANATISQPRGIAGDVAGNLLFSDYGNNRIRKLSYLENADQPSFSVSNVTADSTGNNYSVVITSASGSVTSSVAMINLQLPPVTATFSANRNAISFTWSTVSNVTYQLQSTTNLIAPDWQNWGSPVTATNSSSGIIDLPADPKRFYRVQLRP